MYSYDKLLWVVGWVVHKWTEAEILIYQICYSSIQLDLNIIQLQFCLDIDSR